MGGSPTTAVMEPLASLAKRVLPGGTFGNLGANIIVARGSGSKVYDDSGREYLDYLLGSGPMLVGHAHPEVTDAAVRQVEDGTTFFLTNPHGIELAAEITRAVPCAEMVRFVSTGTEADMYAMRLARVHRKRPKILKFEGGYHGMSDSGLMSLYPKGPSALPRAVPDSPGISSGAQEDILVATFNDVEGTVRLIRDRQDELAGVIVEPMQRIVPPVAGFLEALRAVTRETGVLLIYDEVVTGFRLAYGGAQERYGVIPDLCTLGKACGGGFPLAAIAGKREIMVHFDRAAVSDEDFLIQVGTLSGNPVAAAAGLATLKILREPGSYERIYSTGKALMSALADLAKDSGLPATVVGEPPLFEIVFATGPILNYRDTIRGNAELARRFNALLRDQGILKGETKYYVSLAHTPADVSFTIKAWENAFASLAVSAGAA